MVGTVISHRITVTPVDQQVAAIKKRLGPMSLFLLVAIGSALSLVQFI